MTEFSISEDIASGTFNSDKLQREIIAANCVTDLKGITSVGDKLIISCLEVIDQDALNAVIHDHVAVSLADNKATKIIAIDAKTTAIIRAGFDFDGNHFSLSISAQQNWTGLFVFKDFLSWPMGITNDANATYDLTLENLVPFVLSGAAIVQTAVGTGRALKIAVDAAANQAALDAVVDTR